MGRFTFEREEKVVQLIEKYISNENEVNRFLGSLVINYWDVLSELKVADEDVLSFVDCKLKEEYKD